MENSPLPQHPLDATLASVDGETVLTLQRLLPAPASDVWTALTVRRLVGRWAPYRPSRDLTEPGRVELPESPSPSTDETGNPGESRGEVLSVVPGRMLSLEWGEDTLDFEVVPANEGTQLRLSHTFSDPENAASYAAGWHICLTALDGITEGIDVPAVTGDRARLYGWDALHEEYDELFARSDTSG